MIATILNENHAEEGLVPEWGLSFHIEQAGHSILLDTGSSGKFAENAARLGIDLAQVECGVLSHAHYDHSDGLETFCAVNENAPFYLRKEAAENCYRKNRVFYHYIGIHRGYLKKYESRIRYVSGDQEILPGVTLLPHKGEGLEEKGKRARMYVRKGILWRPDSFAHEQSLVVDTEEGLVVFNSCSHGGADQIIRETKETWPEKKIAALVGGLHLFRSSDDVVRALAERVRQTGIERIYTGHCTGDRAFEILREELGDRVEPIRAGLRIRIG